MSASGLIKNQSVKIKIKKKTGLIKIVSLQETSTPGILKQFKVEPNTDYVIRLNAYTKQNVFIYLVAGKQKTNLLGSDQDLKLHSEPDLKLVKFNSREFTVVTFGLLFSKPAIKDRFYIQKIKLDKDVASDTLVSSDTSVSNVVDIKTNKVKTTIEKTTKKKNITNEGTKKEKTNKTKKTKNVKTTNNNKVI
jgi:hypothetical protein